MVGDGRNAGADGGSVWVLLEGGSIGDGVRAVGVGDGGRRKGQFVLEKARGTVCEGGGSVSGGDWRKERCCWGKDMAVKEVGDLRNGGGRSNWPHFLETRR